MAKFKQSNTTNEEIEGQLERILASEDFHASPMQIAFLRFIVNQTLVGNADQIKGYTVATQVFDRGTDFDQNIDPIVSIQANKLRRALEFYYLTAGKSDRIRIDIPKGGYVPIFDQQNIIAEKVNGNKVSSSDNETVTTWPQVLVRPFQILSGDKNFNHWGIGLAMELATELARYPDIRVLAINSRAQNTPGKRHLAHFEIGGFIYCETNSIKLNIYLTETRTGVQVWSDTYLSATEAGNMISTQEQIARTVAFKMGSEFGMISRTMMGSSKGHPPRTSQSYEAVLHYYDYMLNYTPISFKRAFTALSNAVQNEPECGQAWSMLGRLYAQIHSLDISGFERPLDKAFEYTQRGVGLEPNNQRSRCNLAYIYLFRNELAEGLLEIERALSLNPKCLFIIDGLSYLMTLMGQWERGTAMIRSVIRKNPFYGNYVHYALWVDWLRQKKHKEAYRETLNLNRPKLYWDYLSRAASLGLLGNIKEGKQAARRLLELKPDFRERGRYLIKQYIKFDEIINDVIDGLAKVDINVV